MAKIRALVVEDSLTVRGRLVELLRRDPEIEVVGEAGDGEGAIGLCERLSPDVITLDMMMPGMNGLEATEHIMAYRPTPIVIISSSTNRGDLFKTYDALAAGAVDVLEKPCGDEPDGSWEARLIATVKLVSRIKVVTHPRAKLDRLRSKLESAPAGEAVFPLEKDPAIQEHTCVALGASTGGPSALVEILSGLSPGFPLPVLLVIHIGQPFAAAFADWLDGHSPLRVSYAQDGEPLPGPGNGRVIMAPPDHHLVVRGGHLQLTDHSERHSCRPSIDVLFESVARELGKKAIACLLTGMGRDGAQGLLEIRRAGGRTLAQDEATSVIFGMPREAILLGAAQRVLPLGEIAATLLRLAAGREPGGERRP